MYDGRCIEGEFMAWSLCHSEDVFLELRRTYLLANESLNCLAWAAIMRAQKSATDDTGYTFYTFDEGTESSAHAFVQHSRQSLIMSAMSCTQAGQLMTALGEQSRALRIVEGPKDIAFEFANAWAQVPGQTHALEMNQALYELEHVDMPDAAGGTMVRTGPESKPFLQEWLEGFVTECFPTKPFNREVIEKRVQRLIDEQKGYLWKNREGKLVSMAAIVRESPNTASLSLVYTPPLQRGQGYAARVVATLSQQQLDAGKTACNLHTDLANPTSNGVYTRIGYRKIAESVRIQLLADPVQT